MAVDTRTERQSIIGVYMPTGVAASFFNPGTSGLATDERLTVPHWYAGITPANPAAGGVMIRLHNIDNGFTAFSRSGMGGVLQ